MEWIQVTGELKAGVKYVGIPEKEFDNFQARIAELEGELTPAKRLWMDAQKRCKAQALRGDELEAEVKKLKGKKHITLTQAREMALFSAERAKQRQNWAELEAENKRLKEAIAISYEAICTGNQEAEDKAIGLIEDLTKP